MKDFDYKKYLKTNPLLNENIGMEDGEEKITYYAEKLIDMITPGDEEGVQGLLDYLLDNIDEMPEDWDVDFVEEYSDDIIDQANALDMDQVFKKVDYNLGLGPERHGDFAKEYGDAVKKVYGVDELKSRIKEIIKSTVNEVKKDEHGNHLEPQFQKGDKVTYLGNPGEITKVNKTASGTYTYSVSYDKGTGKTKASDLSNKGGELKKA